MVGECRSFEIDGMGPLGKPIKDIISCQNTYIVYKDSNDSIKYYTVDYNDWPNSFGEIQNRVSHWESITNMIFRKKQAYEIKCILAEAYTRILDNRNYLLAIDIINYAVNRIKSEGNEILKQYYAISALFCSVFVMLLIFLSKLNKDFIVGKFGICEYEIWLIMLFGGIGSFVFVILQLRSYTPDIVIGKKIHIIDGCIRVFYGIVSGLVVALGIKSNFILGFIGTIDKNIFLSAFLGLIAGASDLFIPNLVKQAESSIKLDAEGKDRIITQAVSKKETE